jgi:hypothetical protein
MNDRKVLFEGKCRCEDCGKVMKWESTSWCVFDNKYLLCSKCAIERLKK